VGLTIASGTEILRVKEREKSPMKFWKSGQGLIESSLLMAFIAMASASLFLGASGVRGGSGHQGNLEPNQPSIVCR
jgi:hypothetical protein